MPLPDYQKKVDDILQVYEKPYWAPLSQFARLAEEVGELGRVLNHRYGDKVKKTTEDPDDLEGELGDIFLTIIALANSEGLDLDAALDKVITKHHRRDSDRFKKRAE
jgi:NTP pyrophosphatase (non-canonical NTP hydrolase)